MSKPWLSTLVTIGLLAMAALFLEQPWRSGNPDSGLLQALEDHRLERFKRLLDQGANPNTIFPSNVTVMCEATREGNEAFLQAAIARGGNVNLRSKRGFMESPLFCAIFHRNPRAVWILVQHGADLRMPSCLTCGPENQGSPLVEALNQYKLAYDLYLYMDKNGIRLSAEQMDEVIRGLEVSPPPDPQEFPESNRYYHRLVDALHARGYVFTPDDPRFRPRGEPSHVR